MKSAVKKKFFLTLFLFDLMVISPTVKQHISEMEAKIMFV